MLLLTLACGGHAQGEPGQETIGLCPVDPDGGRSECPTPDASLTDADFGSPVETLPDGNVVVIGHEHEAHAEPVPATGGLPFTDRDLVKIDGGRPFL